MPKVLTKGVVGVDTEDISEALSAEALTEASCCSHR